MGFGTIIGQVLFIIVVMIVAANVLIQNSANVNSYTLAKKDNTNIALEKENSQMEISNMTEFGAAPKSINITVKNSGKLKLDQNDLDLYIDNSRINSSNFQVTNQIDIINPKIFDPDETVVITYSGISSGSHYITVVNEYGAKTSKIALIS